MSKKKDKLDWLELDSGTFPTDYAGPMYGTPDWVRHPERYPELMKRMSEVAQEVWSDSTDPDPGPFSGDLHDCF